MKKSVAVDPNDTVESLYNRWLFPEGIKGLGEAVDLIANEKAPRIPQPEEGASYEPLLNKKESSQVKFENLSAQQLHNFIRGCDKVPGAWVVIDGQTVKLFGSRLWDGALPSGIELQVEGMSRPGIIHYEG